MRDAPRDATGDGVHAVTKPVNLAFDLGVAGLEKEARSLAMEWAARGLPRHDLRFERRLPPEQMLEKRGIELFGEWVDRVRTRMQDAIEDGCQQVGESLASYRAHVHQLASTRAELEAKEREAAELRRALLGRHVSFGYKRFWGSRVGFWLIAGLLALVEFFANYPIFRLLLPMESALAETYKGVLEESERHGLGAGPYRLVADMSFHIEAVVVAFVAVLVIVILGKTLGSSLRPVLALREHETPAAVVGIRSHRRQHWGIIVASTLGLACALSFLFLARREIPQMAQARYASDSARVARLEGAVATAAREDLNAVGRLQGDLDVARRDIAQRTDERSYAIAVERSNLPILLLNLALVLAAAVLGYAYKTEAMEDARGEDPVFAALCARIERLREAEAQGRRAVHETERLQGVIPLFRTVNAQYRGLDPASILAFQTDHRIALPGVDDATPFRTPTELPDYVREFARLAEDAARLSLPSFPSLGLPEEAASGAAQGAAS
jgi:hypothetical protein